MISFNTEILVFVLEFSTGTGAVIKFAGYDIIIEFIFETTANLSLPMCCLKVRDSFTN